jgi:SAM-dependent methyltransferase
MKDTSQIDYGGVRRYFAAIHSDQATCGSYMAHAQDLPGDATRYRFRAEQKAIREWLDAIEPKARVLDLGCGAGTWTRLFAERFGSVVAVEQSTSMLSAAKEHVAAYSNVEFFDQDVREPLPPGPFDLVFLGGLCMYLSDADAVAVVRAAMKRLAPGGRVILRESTVESENESSDGKYQAIYRSVGGYRRLFGQAGLDHVSVRRNHGYSRMEMAVELVELRRRYLPFLPGRSALLGALTWWSLRATSPISFGAVPRMQVWLGLRWPRLQNHFFLLENVVSEFSESENIN